MIEVCSENIASFDLERKFSRFDVGWILFYMFYLLSLLGKSREVQFYFGIKIFVE